MINQNIVNLTYQLLSPPWKKELSIFPTHVLRSSTLKHN